ncbi:MAG: hypothetical protein ABR991_11205 [Terracidiphilus sp.]|jgi:hypothetical protein
MTIQLELDPETEARLKAQAVLHGVAPEEYAEKLLDAAIPSRPAGRGKLTREELHAMLERIGEGAENRPKLPTSAFSRESFYEDHP